MAAPIASPTPGGLLANPFQSRPAGGGAFEIGLLRDVPGVGRAGDRFAGRHASCARRCYTGICLPAAAPGD